LTEATVGPRQGVIGHILGLARTELGGRLLRYSAVSIIALTLSEVLLVSFNGGLGWGAAKSSTVATALATIPAYFLTRQWVWDRSGRSHLRKEVLPFWVIALIGWAFATLTVQFAEDRTKGAHLHGASSVAIVALAYIFAYGVLWVGKFVLFNKVLFGGPGHHGRPGDSPSPGVSSRSNSASPPGDPTS
jgi:putative flippase GtrA